MVIMNFGGPRRVTATGAAPFDDIHQIINNAIFQPHHNVEIAQTDVSIDQDDLLIQPRQRHAYICGGRRFADAAFARCDGDDFAAHANFLSVF